MEREELTDKVRRWIPDAIMSNFAVSDGDLEAVNIADDSDAEEQTIYGIMARILEEAAEECRSVEAGEAY